MIQMATQFAINVYKITRTGSIVDLVRYTTAPTAAEMEDRVTELHRAYPAPTFRVDVKTVPRY
jgi:hypothetical protein